MMAYFGLDINKLLLHHYSSHLRVDHQQTHTWWSLVCISQTGLLQRHPGIYNDRFIKTNQDGRIHEINEPTVIDK